MPTVLTVSKKDDIHAYVVRDVLRSRFGIHSHYLTVDSLYDKCRVSWTDGGQLIITVDDKRFHVSEIDLVWWRRSSTAQKNLVVDDGAQEDL